MTKNTKIGLNSTITPFHSQFFLIKRLEFGKDQKDQLAFLFFCFLFFLMLFNKFKGNAKTNNSHFKVVCQNTAVELPFNLLR